MLASLPLEILVDIFSWLDPSRAAAMARLGRPFARCLRSLLFVRTILSRNVILPAPAVRRTHEFDASFFLWPPLYQTVYAELCLKPMRGLNWGCMYDDGPENDTADDSLAIDPDEVELSNLYGGGHVGNLDAPIPACIGMLSENLVYLNLNKCGLVGRIPLEITRLYNIEFISMAVNDLTGPLPQEIGNLQKLTSFNLFHNKLDGEIPETLGNLLNLVDLFLGDNNLTGRIPNSIGCLSNLSTLSLSSNALEGELPIGIYSLQKLECLFLNDNDLSGEISSKIRNMSGLVQLYLANNRFSGAVPIELTEIESFERADFSGNPELRCDFTDDFDITI
ncbi:hypothetical protein HDU83_007605 [Entophlyctis luteolus]|nr:hypothetical protein HDU82_001347 [Entophlyctis luteolus]KAJ3352803.1 hypothetical protein HDU83_007605 [Entophlyctis luteolus]